MDRVIGESTGHAIRAATAARGGRAAGAAGRGRTGRAGARHATRGRVPGGVPNERGVSVAGAARPPQAPPAPVPPHDFAASRGRRAAGPGGTGRARGPGFRLAPPSGARCHAPSRRRPTGAHAPTGAPHGRADVCRRNLTRSGAGACRKLSKLSRATGGGLPPDSAKERRASRPVVDHGGLRTVSRMSGRTANNLAAAGPLPDRARPPMNPVARSRSATGHRDGGRQGPRTTRPHSRGKRHPRRRLRPGTPRHRGPRPTARGPRARRRGPRAPRAGAGQGFCPAPPLTPLGRASPPPAGGRPPGGCTPAAGSPPRAASPARGSPTAPAARPRGAGRS